jgi:hypothetical protein
MSDTIIGAIIGALGVIFAALLPVTLRNVLTKNKTRISQTKCNILGKRKADFALIRNDQTLYYTEIIELKIQNNAVMGFIIPDSRNYDALKNNEKNKPLRVEGQIHDNYFTGYWFHPLELHRFRGAFQLIIEPSCKKMYGKWIGFSESLNLIDSGEWLWERIT